MRRFIFLILMLSFGSIAAAQTSTPTVAGVRDGRLLLAQGPGSQILQVDLDWQDKPLLARPGGDGLLYLLHGDRDRLMYWDGLQHIELTTDFVPGCVPTFTPDGQAVYYVQGVPATEAGDATPGPRQPHWVLRQPLQAGAVPERVTMIAFDFAGGGGDGPPVPMENMFWIEQGAFGIPPVFGVTPHGVLYRSSLSCLAGLRLMHNDVITDLPGRKLAISPDGTQAAFTAPDADQLAIIDLATLEQRAVAVNGDPLSPYFQLHWADDIYYTVAESFETDYGLTEAQRDDFREVSYAQIDQSHDSALYRLDPQTGEQQRLYTAPKTWAIVRMQSTDRYLYFAQIPDAQPIVDAFLAGQLVADDYSMLVDLVRPNVYRMPLGGGAVELVQRDLQTFVPYVDD